MLQVQKIACNNDAGFVMSFKAVCADGSSESTGDYPVDKSATIDLGQTPFKTGSEFWPEVHAVLGKTKTGDPHVIFEMNGQTATYEVKGTTLHYSVKLIG
jgi:hypothetical protein